MDLSGFLEQWKSPGETLQVKTSGSTGEPKLITVEKRKMLASARITCDYLGLRKGNRALLCLPLDYIAGKMMVVRCLERGMDICNVTPGNHPFAFLEGNFFDLAALVPSQVYCSLSIPSEREMLRQTRNVIIGGGPVSKEIEEAVKDFPNAVWSTYGMTETLSHIALRRLSGKDRSLWYTPFNGVQVSLSPEGCLQIYAPEVNDEMLITNDIAEFNEDGRRFRIIGRKDNVICSGGIKLHIEEIEEQLRPLIPFPFCITKRPDAKFGEVAVLLVEGTMDYESAIESLPQYSRPKAIIKVSKIPLTENGKIDRASALTLAKE